MGLLDFPCGRRAGRSEVSPPPSTRTESASPSTSIATAGTSGESLEKRRRRSSQGSASPWRPSLIAINEDGASPAVTAASAPATPEKNKKIGGGLPAVKAANVKSAGRVAMRAVSNDYRHYNGIPTVMPAFGPAVFWF